MSRDDKDLIVVRFEGDEPVVLRRTPSEEEARTTARKSVRELPDHPVVIYRPWMVIASK